mmetsp:Transcript_54531/g.137665  ORF Transcript_54531/g.137665 Transcript_54531/m.137665 type:complete len:273 (+) Transcript_54531:2549-3367(+)
MPGNVFSTTSGPSTHNAPSSERLKTLFKFPKPSSAVGCDRSQVQLPSTMNLYCTGRGWEEAATVPTHRPSDCFVRGTSACHPSQAPRATTLQAPLCGHMSSMAGLSDDDFAAGRSSNVGQPSVNGLTPAISLYKRRSKTTDGLNGSNSSYPRTLPILAQLAAVRAAFGKASRGSRFSLGVWLSWVQSKSSAGQCRGRRGTVPVEMRANDALRVIGNCFRGVEALRRLSVGTCDTAPIGCAPHSVPLKLPDISCGLLHCIDSRMRALMPKVPW